MQNRKNCTTAGGTALRPPSTITKFSDYAPSVTSLNCNTLFSTGAKSGSFCAKKKQLLVPTLSKILDACWVAFTAVDKTFQAIMSCRRDELRKNAGLILKLCIIAAVQDLKISFHKQFSVPPPHFWLVPPHFICYADGTELECS